MIQDLVVTAVFVGYAVGVLLLFGTVLTWVERKHPPLLEQAHRAAIVDAIRFVTYTHLATGTTESVLRRLGPRYYAKGADWRGRLPAEELAVCAELGTEVVYLDTVRESSTALLDRYERRRNDS